jgi:hypothetical protein
MSLKKFGENDVILNTMKTHPHSEFFIFDGTVHYNNVPGQSGAFSDRILNIPPGHVSLYELNIDKGDANLFSYPFITKQSSGAAFATVSATSYSNAFVFGDMMTSSYPMSASITRELMATAGQREVGVDSNTGDTFEAAPTYPHFYALKNRLNFYGTLSEHYKVSSSYGDKALQTVNLLSIPSIFYGQGIRPGTMSLKWYCTGSMIGELQDVKRNGELIQVGPVGSPGSGSVAGVVMYDEGFVLLTGSWDLNQESLLLVKSSTKAVKPSWVYWGAGALDGVTVGTTGASYLSASSQLSFQGINEIQVMTMFAHAKRGEVNYSNNPTFLEYGQTAIAQTSSLIYEENTSRRIYNTVSSSYPDWRAPFKRQVYVSRVAVYDESRNLIGLATLSNPVLKEEDEDLSLKLRLDI